MQFLLDSDPDDVAQSAEAFPALVAGQLLTPATSYRLWGGRFAVDNSCYSSFDANGLLRLLDRNTIGLSRCLWVAVPDVVGSAVRTLEAFEAWSPRLAPWPLAFVAQDGQETMPIPWARIAAVFIGGTTAWKESPGAAQIVSAARIMGKPCHVGRVGGVSRYRKFARLGADTCDSSAHSRMSREKLKEFATALEKCRHPLFSECE